MRSRGPSFDLSATDLSKFLSCRHLTALDMAAARGDLSRPPRRDDPLLDLLIKRGQEHEQQFVDSLSTGGATITNLAQLGLGDREAALHQTLAAMRGGASVIVQGALALGPWYGRPDIMQRVPLPSALGDWSYEIMDTKLSRDTKAGTILQLSLYSEMLAAAQGVAPEFFHVVTPDATAPRHTFRVNDYAAYFRLVRERLLDTVAQDHKVVAQENYPEPVDFCDYCTWFAKCRDKRRADDHLSLVAGISKAQRRELESHSVGTLAALAALPLPLTFKPARGAAASYVRVRTQAKVQFDSRGLAVPLHVLRPLESGTGLARLPEPSPGDVFLDLEGDPFAAEGGREYLFGLVAIEANGAAPYHSYWGTNERDERKAFEAVMDLIARRWEKHPGMHVYHYAPYEPSAFKRLMGRHATRELELDSMLRAGRFVDLYAVVRQAMHVGVERYSIKNLEVLYGFTRSVALEDANESLRAMETALWVGAVDLLPHRVRAAVEGYNKDDCVSTLRLRDWLEGVRAAAESDGTEVPRPAETSGEPSSDLDDRAKRVEALRQRLHAGISDVPSERDDEQQGRWLLGYLLDWHRREDKASWWEYFRLRDMPEEELFDEPQAIAGLEFVKRVDVKLHKVNRKPTGTVTDRYHYPPQEMEITDGSDLKLKEGTFGKAIAVDRDRRFMDVQKGKSQAENHPSAVFAHTNVSTKVMEESIYALAEGAAADGTLSLGPKVVHRAFRDLMLKNAPRLRKGAFDSTGIDMKLAKRLASELHDSILPVQGPPGAGKTHTGARMIVDLVGAGKRVGVTANSHKVIRNLLDAVHVAAKEAKASVRLAQKVGDGDPDDDATPVVPVRDNGAALALLTQGDTDVLGGTAWLWSRDDFEHAVDVLFVDEAGQMSLANVVAISRAARNVVLLGDPQQLEQPIKGSHPVGAETSALQHVLGAHQTIPADRGIFLPVTWRLAPNVCAFTSELFYESKLASKPGLEAQVLSGTGDFDGSGLWLKEVPHMGNVNASDEEVDAVAAIVATLTKKGAKWTNEQGTMTQLKGDDILIVAPYNAQVNRIAERLSGAGVRVGTVDKFQGQEAPVVIYSMATSRPEDAPRGMEFLYSPNRLNVATSRARCAAILVASPALFEPECHSPRQMRLANALCRYREMARK